MSDVIVTTAAMVAEDITSGFARMPKRDEGVHWLKAWEWDLLRAEIERLRGLLRESVIAAYIRGALDVHSNYQPDRDPDFTEAAHDYADAALAGEELERAGRKRV